MFLHHHISNHILVYVAQNKFTSKDRRGNKEEQSTESDTFIAEYLKDKYDIVKTLR